MVELIRTNRDHLERKDLIQLNTTPPPLEALLKHNILLLGGSFNPVSGMALSNHVSTLPITESKGLLNQTHHTVSYKSYSLPLEEAKLKII